MTQLEVLSEMQYNYFKVYKKILKYNQGTIKKTWYYFDIYENKTLILLKYIISNKNFILLKNINCTRGR